MCERVCVREGETERRVHLLKEGEGVGVPHRQNSFRKSQFPNKSVNLFFIFVIVEDKLTDLWGI